MIGWASAAFVGIAGAFLLHRVCLLAFGREVLEVVGSALSTMGDRRLNDDEKERTMQRSAGRLIRLVALMLLLGTGAVLAPVGVVWVAQEIGWPLFDPALQALRAPLFLSVSGSVALAVTLVVRRKARSAPTGRPTTYTVGEQLLHRLAFCTSGAQLTIARIEDRTLARKLAAYDTRRPVFITGLPGSGTTLLLECCARVPELASHCYRDMPFLLAPATWSLLSRPFRRQGQPRERAHADGMMIDFDSPEAFEEMIWMTFWTKPYGRDRITPWNERDPHPAFEAFLKNHMGKVIHLRRGARAPEARYVSKNNLNISRLGLLGTMFPDGVTVVPFRDPVQHCLSLQRQHQNFSTIQAKDPFASEYMRQIGHFDFGENLRPVDFDGWVNRRTHERPDQLGFWIEYWVAAYTHILDRHRAIVHLFDYDALCDDPKGGLRRLGEILRLSDPDSLSRAAPPIEPRAPREIDTSQISHSVFERARALHARLVTAAGAEGVVETDITSLIDRTT